MKTSDFDFDLPEELVAQKPCEKRGHSRMMILSRINGQFQDVNFGDFIHHLRNDDVLVLNNTQVINARLFGRKNGDYQGAHCEFLLLKPLDKDFTLWEAYVKPAKRLPLGARVKLLDKNEHFIDPEAVVEIVEKQPDGSVIVRLIVDVAPLSFLEKYGYLPLPPYIQRLPTEEDNQRYQTVFAQLPGAVAAPTAGLHFTQEVMEQIRKKGVQIAYVTLHTGAGTFKPVTVENPLEHKMHSEHFILPESTAELINQAKKQHRRIIAVGTTSVRVLESCVDNTGKLIAQESDTSIFLYPPYRPKIVDGLLTNFHLPKSTLLMLVSTFSSKDDILNCYHHAVNEHYRFYSYGDCMFITPEKI